MATNISFGLYIHIPFCVSKCSYCDFASIKKNSLIENEYIKALCKEMKMHRAKFLDKTFNTVFIGGGTPSCISITNFSRILDSVYENFNIINDEFTVEINPGTGDFKLFSLLKKSGVNRASIGLQCANDSVLKDIGRIHTTKDFVSTLEQIKQAGINNFSADIITGLPQQTKKDIIDTINLVASLNANHISMYSLKLEESTPLYKAVRSKATILPTTDTEHAMSAAATKHLESIRYHRYEISNYAKKGYESKHNLKYWKRIPYLGLGVAASSMYDEIRKTNTRDIATYIESINNNNFPICYKEDLSKGDIAFEMIMLSTRLSDGMEYKKYNDFTQDNFCDKYSKILSDLKNEGLILDSNSHFILSAKGLDLQNQVLLKFMD